MTTTVLGYPIINGVEDRDHASKFIQAGSSVSVTFDSEIEGWYLVFVASAKNGNSELGPNASYYSTGAVIEWVTVTKP
ncbi:hypothetical protein [Candidatus Palauibacter sp.]|uniref:hypothetical protein n=1 Tax=Candidatus Palauibacter sp. TaxID=3101350 RepID=UPI003B51EC07